MRKMRLIAEAYQEIVQHDPDTALTKSAFRRLVLEGRIPSVSVGNRRLVSMEDVECFFCMEDHRKDRIYETDKIHRIKE